MEGLFTDQFSVFPHGSLLMLMATSLKSQAILFKHGITGSDDPQRRVNQIEKEAVNLSIRHNVTFPIIRELGFSTMDQNQCSGKCFDPSGSFSERTRLENLRTFNGLHVPNDKNELDRTFTHLSTIIKSWQSM